MESTWKMYTDPVVIHDVNTNFPIADQEWSSSLGKRWTERDDPLASGAFPDSGSVLTDPKLPYCMDNHSE